MSCSNHKAILCSGLHVSPKGHQEQFLKGKIVAERNVTCSQLKGNATEILLGLLQSLKRTLPSSGPFDSSWI